LPYKRKYHKNGKDDLALLRRKTSISPFNAWLIIRGLATLPLRMRVHQENAMQIASYLEQHHESDLSRAALCYIKA
jgi:cystathionine beta-lyase/cystathionine gamma-synthase